MKPPTSLLLPLLVCGRLFACNCSFPPPCTKVGPNAVIFVGVPMNEAFPSTSTLSDQRPVRFRIERVFQGMPDGSRFVDVDTAAGWGDSCAAEFRVGVPYVVYAEGDTTPFSTLTGAAYRFRSLFFSESVYPRRLSTNLCKRSPELQDAADDLRFLEAFRAGRTISTIEGELRAGPGEKSRIEQLFPGTVVTASGPNGQQYQARVGENGRFQIAPVPAGTYKVKVERPRLRDNFSDHPVQVPEGGCGVFTTSMGFDGIVSGRIQEPRGGPPPAITVQLIPVHEGDSPPPTLETTSAADGTYTFRGVPAGRYVVAVNADHEPTKEIPHKRVFYPGVATRARARVIQMGEAQRLENLHFTLSSRLNPRTITAQMVWADGTPARYVHTWCAPLSYAPRQHLLTDRDGRIEFPAMDGLWFEIGSAAASNYEIPVRRNFSARAVRVPPGQSTSIRLILSIPPK